MPNGNLGKKLVDEMIKDCQRREMKESICECVAQQIRGLYTLDKLDKLPELRELFMKIEPIAYDAVANMGDCVIKTEIGIAPPTLKENK